MGERLRDNFFIVVRIVIMLVFSLYGFFETSTGVSPLILLLVALYFCMMALKELTSDKRFKILLLGLGAVVFIGILVFGGNAYILMGLYLIYEALALFKATLFVYFMPLLLAFVPTPIGFLTQLLVASMMTVIYVQHDLVIVAYQKQIHEETVLEQGLKRDMESREQASKAELKKNIVMAENRILEERSSLSQALHDKLGHNINGSIYQLEAIKVLMEKDPERSKEMTQAVIDQLRTGMDEIRGILRRERPEKKELALIQLYNLCRDCNDKGVETNLETEGDVNVLNEKLWEVILDNSFEAVSNSMKYSKCKNILITIRVMNKLVRCTIRDDGMGCNSFSDGMGISGMRRRVREVGGTLDFETVGGFTVNMLLPLS
ncbi:MAG: hypothetical protein IK125_06575 [Lachnospiraceae bacterium]|nr:hypothetical protein [Lachnospiraceae bacterium]